MKNKLLLALACLLLCACGNLKNQTSPNGKIELAYVGDKAQNHAFKVNYIGENGAIEALDIPVVGVLTSNEWGKNLTLEGVSDFCR